MDIFIPDNGALLTTQMEVLMTSRTVVSEITHNDSKYPKLSLNNMNISCDDVTVGFFAN